MQYVILGIVQGLTEFLPVSSSGHLVLLSYFLNIEKSQVLPIVVIAHLGTLLAVICFFFRDILGLLKDLVALVQIVVVTLATGIVYLLIGRDSLEKLFINPVVVCFALLVTAICLILTRKFKHGRRNMLSLGIKDAFILGIAQGLAIIPGISRSGLTIFVLLTRRVIPSEAFKFSFIAAIPVIAGSFILEAARTNFVFDLSPLNFWIVLVTSFVFGLLGLFILNQMVKKLRMHYFAYYLIPIALFGLLFFRS